MDKLSLQALTVFATSGARAAQEDCVFASREKGIFVVADGFGGPQAGLGAAQAACEGVRGFLEKEAGDREATLPFVLRNYFSLPANVLFNALIHANRKILELNKGRSIHERGGASVIAGLIEDSFLVLANVGACEAWLFRDGQAKSLVVPRTYGRLLDPFLEDSPESLRIPLMALGMTEDLEPEIMEVRLRGGDWVVLSTDGLHRREREQILQLQAEKQGCLEAAEKVKSVLKTSNYTDNLAFSIALL